ncbi:hydantoinase B/oxoprolinase family protein, partial [bacterium]|nr:hydantoinase B/oxoprolinase family protein [bacterium]
FRGDVESDPAVAIGNTETSQRVVDALFRCFGVVAGSQGTMNNLLLGNDRFGYYETICGGTGAGPDFDGCDAVHSHMTNTRLTDPEVLEHRYPIRLESFSIRRGSGGRGRHRGGDGVVRTIQATETLRGSLLGQHRVERPYGLEGGDPGKAATACIERADGSIQLMPGIAAFDLRPEDRLRIETPGGGGFGAPPEA